MKKLVILMLILDVLVVGQNSLFAQTATCSATAVLGTGLGVQPTPGQLSFGKISASETAGTCSVSTKNVVSVTGGTIYSGGSPTAAVFTVTGKIGVTYSINFPTATVTLDHTDKIHSMTVSDFKVETNSKGIGNTGSIDTTTGSDVFVVGATLSVGANQIEGSYAGILTMIVSYN